MTTRLFLLLSALFALFLGLATAQADSSTSPSAAPVPPPTVTSTTPSGSSRLSQSPTFPTLTPRPGNGTGNGTLGNGTNYGSQGGPPDVLLQVPELHVGRIELDVDNLRADINLNAKVAGLVQINAGVAVSVEKVNITIADVDAQLELIVRLGHLADIVNRVFASLDLNPLLITAITNVTSLVGEVIGAVDGLLGSITQGGSTLNFLIDNLGNIVQQVVGTATGAVDQIVGNYLTNMTLVTGSEKQVGGGLIQKTFSYEPLKSLVDIVFNTAGQVVRAVVQNKS